MKKIKFKWDENNFLIISENNFIEEYIIILFEY